MRDNALTQTSYFSASPPLDLKGWKERVVLNTETERALG